MANPFQDLVPKTEAAAADPFADLVPQSQPEAPESQGGFLEALGNDIGEVSDFISSAQIGTASLMRGVVQGGTRIANALGVETASIDSALNRHDARDRERLTKISSRSPIASAVGEAVGSFIPAAIPVGGQLGLLGRVATEAGVGGALGGAQFAQEDESKLGNAALGGALGALGPLATAGVGAGIRGVNSLRSGASKRALAGVLGDSAEQAKGVAGAAKELDTFVTPGEASGRPSLLSDEGKIALTDTAQRVGVEDKLAARDVGLVKSFNETVENIVSEGDEVLETAKVKAFTNAFSETIPQPKAQKLLDDPTIADVRAKVAKLPENVGKFSEDTPTNGIEQLDAIKRFLRDEAKSADITGKLDRARVLNGAADKISTTLKSSSPQYKLSQELSSREIAKRELKESVASIKDPTPKKLFDKFLASSSAREKFFGAVNKDPKSRRSAVLLAKVLPAVSTSKIQNAVTKSIDTGPKSIAAGSTRVLNRVRSFLNGKDNAVMVDMITSGKWVDQLEELAKLTPAQQLGGLLELLGNVSGRPAAATVPGQE